MRRLFALGAVLLAAVGGARVAPAADSGTSVTIVSFSYSPESVEIAPGTRVVWTNVDPTVHTVTADDGAFNSGRLRPGQQYELTFNGPGTYTYFCEPHEFMRASVVVLGGDATAATVNPEPPPGDPPSTPSPSDAHAPPTSSAPATGTAFADAGSTPVPASDEAPADAARQHDVGAAGSLVAAAPTPQPMSAVTDGQVIGAGTSALPAVPLGGGLLSLTAAMVLQAAVAHRRRAAAASRLGAAALTLVSGAIHLQLGLAVGYPEPLRTLLLAQAAAATVLALLLVTDDRVAAWGAALIHTATLAAFAASRTVGLFGFRELGWDPSPQSALAAAAAAGALALLTVAATIPRRSTRR